jgi:phosphoribosylformimino-5-aminoimidazole carboxamide ribotide isomerase
MQIIPAIDLIDGKCVRLTQGDYQQKTEYHNDPVEVAKSFSDVGVTRLHVVDLDGAKAGAVQQLRVLERIAAQTNLQIDFGGGVKQEQDVASVRNAGATWVTVGSVAAKEPAKFEQWITQWGASQFMLGADVKEERITVGGWLENTELYVYDFIQSYWDRGVQEIFCTDVSKDGKLEGPSLALYQRIKNQIPALPLIASGGVSQVADLYALQEIGCGAVIVGKAIYEGRITLTDIKKFSLDQPTC